MHADTNGICNTMQIIAINAINEISTQQCTVPTQSHAHSSSGIQAHVRSILWIQSPVHPILRDKVARALHLLDRVARRMCTVSSGTQSHVHSILREGR